MDETTRTRTYQGATPQEAWDAYQRDAGDEERFAFSAFKHGVLVTLGAFDRATTLTARSRARGAFARDRDAGRRA